MSDLVNIDGHYFIYPKPVLYSYYRSSCSWRVRIALSWKDIDYDYRAINLAKGEQFSEAFTTLNPLQEVPVFVDKDQVLTQSVSIVEYLEASYPFKPLLPSDIILRTKTQAVVQTIASGIQPLQNLRVLKVVGENHIDWAKQWIEKGFKDLEKQLQPLHGRCCINDDVTLADAFLVPQIFNAHRFGVDMSQFPLLTRIHDHVQSYDAFKVAHPSQQPDFPGE